MIETSRDDREEPSVPRLSLNREDAIPNVISLNGLTAEEFIDLCDKLELPMDDNAIYLFGDILDGRCTLDSRANAIAESFGCSMEVTFEILATVAGRSFSSGCSMMLDRTDTTRFLTIKISRAGREQFNVDLECYVGLLHDSSDAWKVLDSAVCVLVGATEAQLPSLDGAPHVPVQLNDRISATFQPAHELMRTSSGGNEMQDGPPPVGPNANMVSSLLAPRPANVMFPHVVEICGADDDTIRSVLHKAGLGHLASKFSAAIMERVRLATKGERFDVEGLWDLIPFNGEISVSACSYVSVERSPAPDDEDNDLDDELSVDGNDAPDWDPDLEMVEGGVTPHSASDRTEHDGALESIYDESFPIYDDPGCVPDHTVLFSALPTSIAPLSVVFGEIPAIYGGPQGNETVPAQFYMRLMWDPRVVTMGALEHEVAEAIDSVCDMLATNFAVPLPTCLLEELVTPVEPWQSSDQAAFMLGPLSIVVARSARSQFL